MATRLMNTQIIIRSLRTTRTAVAICMLAALPLWVQGVGGRQNAGRAGSPRATIQPVAAPAEVGGATPQALHLLVGHSRLIYTAARVIRISTADPNILDVMVASSNQVLIDGKAPGSVSLVVWDASGASQSYEVTVDLDVQALANQIHAAFPDETIQVESQKDSVVLSGDVPSQAVADKMLEIAKATWPKTVSMLEIPGPESAEILLQVKFAEVDRSVVSQLGFNLLSLPGAKTVGAISTQQFGGPQIGAPLGTTGATTTSTGTSTTTTTGTGGFTLSNLLNIFLYRPDINLGATIQALEENNLLQILAEPNVITESGKEASFLSGGQFPYPILESSGTGIPVVTILFKEFGIKLDFTPTLTPGGLIHLKVLPEVSSLDYTNALTLQGFVIPALSVSRVQSEMDLQDGQSFAIAGLINDQITNQLSKIPGLSSIPLLGKIFQSRSLNKSKNELLILVTPHIIKALAPNQVPPLPQFPVPLLPLASAPKHATAPTAPSQK
jgi:pilus assembly protein CpaC